MGVRVYAHLVYVSWAYSAATMGTHTCVVMHVPSCVMMYEAGREQVCCVCVLCTSM